MCTTIDIDDPILKELKRLQRREGKSLGRLVPDLLAQSLVDARQAPKSGPAFQWIAKPLGARVDLTGISCSPYQPASAQSTGMADSTAVSTLGSMPTR